MKDQETQDVIKEFRNTILALSVVIVLMFMVFAVVFTYVLLIQVPEVVQTAMADYFSDYEVLP